MTEPDPQGDRDAARLLADEREFSATLDRVARALATELDLGVIVQRLTDEATAVVGAEFGAFFYNVTGAGGEKYMLYTLSGVPKEKFSRFPMPRNTAVFAPTFAGDGVVRFDDVTVDYRYGNNPPHRGMPPGHLPVRSYLAAPVVSRDGSVHGGLFFGHGRAAVFGERAERIVGALAAHAAIALDNARLHRAAVEARERAERLAAEVVEQCRAMEAVLQGERERRRRLEERLARAGLAGPADD
ncbi:MAG TPA: GAF domain-containing protein [Polyangiaceae bacterium]|nr:GAF domain-containing protein [Polyangiaceae bacterium]